MDATIVSALVWPIVVLIIAIVVIILFRIEISRLIARTKSVGKGGLETFENQPTQPRDEKKGIEKFLQTYDNRLLLEAEELVLRDLSEKEIDLPADREKALIRSLASTSITLHFERIYSLIWASQLAFLRFLNSRDQGADVTDIEPFYESGKRDKPVWFENYPLESWAGFLEASNLILNRDSRYFITVSGREFLKYLIIAAKAGPYNG